MKNHYTKIAIAITLIFCTTASFLATNQRMKVAKMNEEILAMPMKSVCIGRFIVDVPQHAIVTYRQARVAGWTISTILENNEEFDQRMLQKEDSLNRSKNERNGVSLEVSREIKSNEVNGKIFLFNRRWIGLMRSGKEVISEIVAIDALVRANGISYEFKADFRNPPQMDKLEKILLQLQAIPESHVPQRPGFCFDHGFIRDPLEAGDNEYTSIFFGVKEHPDLAISLSSSAGLDPTHSLLQRDTTSVIQQEYASRFHRLRGGPRSLNNVPGEEVLDRVDELNGVKVHGFMWESIGEKNNVYLPSLSLELDTGLGRPGKPVNSSLSDAEAMAWWDKISSSLRRRPVTAISGDNDAAGDGKKNAGI